jgi:hypothetical protein
VLCLPYWGMSMTFFVRVPKNRGKEVLHIGEFHKQHHAIACARRVIDSFLLNVYEIDMTADELLNKYQTAGDVPSIFRDGDDTRNVPFSHLEYALERCKAICGIDGESGAKEGADKDA